MIPQICLLYQMASKNKYKEDCKMKERYEEPKMEIVEFETEDIITASNDTPTAPIGEQTIKY